MADAELQEGTCREMLSLEETISTLDWVSELPSDESAIFILQKCRERKNLAYAKRLHSFLCSNGLESHRAVGNYIVPMFVECGSVSFAQHVLNRLVNRNEHSWTSLILGYIQCGKTWHALNLYQKMGEDSVYPSRFTHMALLKACARLKDVEKGREIHAEVALKGFEGDLLVGNAMVDMYAKCGTLAEAQEVFNKLPIRDVVSWNSLIAGYAEHGPGQEAIECFKQMQLVAIIPSAVTFVCVLKACSSIGALDKGREIHMEITQNGFERGVFVSSTLVDMYAKCGSLSEAQEVFDKLPARDIVSWNALITGYAEHGSSHEALDCFKQMQLEGLSPNDVTFACGLKACASIRSIEEGRHIHTQMVQKGFERDHFVGSTLVDMYAKCGSVSEAQNVFDELPVRDVVLWAALIAGYAEHGPGQKAIKCFEQMQLDGVSPDAITFACILKACGSIGAIDKGYEIHAEITHKGYEKGISIGNTLVDMYAKCGSLSEAHGVFEKLQVRNVVSWSAMIQGYGLNHEGDMVIQCFEDMQEEGVKPDAITFTCLLAACSHTNLVFKGQEYFQVMSEECGIAPTIDHYTCIVDLLARSGQFYEAEKFIETLQYPISEGTWTALLSACNAYGDAGLGWRCFQQLVQMNPESSVSYVLMANIYASAGRWIEAHRIEELRKHARAKKKPAIALIEVNEKVHQFMVGNNPAMEISAMLETLRLRMKENGHVPNLDLVLRASSSEEKESMQ